jgi:hypothetical protein
VILTIGAWLVLTAIAVAPAIGRAQARAKNKTALQGRWQQTTTSVVNRLQDQEGRRETALLLLVNRSQLIAQLYQAVKHLDRDAGQDMTVWKTVNNKAADMLVRRVTDAYRLHIPAAELDELAALACAAGKLPQTTEALALVSDPIVMRVAQRVVRRYKNGELRPAPHVKNATADAA